MGRAGEAFLIESPSQFPSDGPNRLTGRKYAREFDEVKSLGSDVSSARTGDQTDMALVWADGPILFTRISCDLSAGYGLKIADKARWSFWRPITAIHEAGEDGNR